MSPGGPFLPLLLALVASAPAAAGEPGFRGLAGSVSEASRDSSEDSHILGQVWGVGPDTERVWVRTCVILPGGTPHESKGGFHDAATRTFSTVHDGVRIQTEAAPNASGNGFTFTVELGPRAADSSSEAALAFDKRSFRRSLPLKLDEVAEWNEPQSPGKPPFRVLVRATRKREASEASLCPTGK